MKDAAGRDIKVGDGMLHAYARDGVHWECVTVQGFTPKMLKVLDQRGAVLTIGPQNCVVIPNTVQLEKDSAFLAALEAQGVDNFEGYSAAYREVHGEEEED